MFERRLRNVERLAVPDRERRLAERRHDRRDASLTQRSDGSWRLSGSFGSLQGAELAKTGFVDAEFRADWADARERMGDDVDVDDLRRDENHRRADALLRAMTAGAANPDGGLGSVPTVNVLIDEEDPGDRDHRRTPRSVPVSGRGVPHPER